MTKIVAVRYVYNTPIRVLMEIMGVETREEAVRIFRRWVSDMQYEPKHQFDDCITLEDILEAHPFPKMY